MSPATHSITLYALSESGEFSPNTATISVVFDGADYTAEKLSPMTHVRSRTPRATSTETQSPTESVTATAEQSETPPAAPTLRHINNPAAAGVMVTAVFLGVLAAIGLISVAVLCCWTRRRAPVENSIANPVPTQSSGL
jgi:hypothetical protein